ncbi:MAG: Uncharacterised protein [Opitutia bacterium UBA7350]|nr:MAG: Uncharacterised protein [Opitutae bacterium UBA7350]
MAFCGFFILSGCSVAILNTTSETMPRSASGSYTLSARVALTDALVDRDSIAPYIVIDGETYPMKPHPYGGGFYQYQYNLPAKRSKALFYYELHFRYLKDHTPDVIKKEYTELSTLSVVDTELTLEASNITTLRIIPASIDLGTRERQAVIFELPQPAPEGGIPIKVTTDVPHSIIMPEVFISAGTRTTSVTLQGNRLRKGKLFIQAPGLEEIKVPVRVR